MALQLRDVMRGCIAILCAILSFASATLENCDGDFEVSDFMSYETLSLCPRYNGNITLRFGGRLPPVIRLDNLTVFEGSLTVEAPALGESPEIRISAIELTQVTGNLAFIRVRKLVDLSFPKLNTVGAIMFDTVTFRDPDVNVLGAGYFDVLYSAFNITLVDTNVAFLAGGAAVSLVSEGPSSTSVTVINNEALTNITLPGYYDHTIAIDIRNNNEDLQVSFPDVTEASVRLNNISGFSAPALLTLRESLYDGSDLMEISETSLKALELPSLTTILGDLEIVSNPSLTSLSLPSLRNLETLEISGNRQLHNISLPALATIDDSLQISSPINFLDLGEALGPVDIETYGALGCPTIRQDLQNSSQVDCSTASSAPSSSGTTDPESVSGDEISSDGLSSSAKIGIGVGVGVGVPLLLAAIIFFCLRSRKQKKSRNAHSVGAGGYSKSEQYHDSGESPVSPVGYGKVPHDSATTEDMQEQPHDRRPPSSLFADEQSPPDQDRLSPDDRVELEEQQGPRHEMDARSLNDIDFRDEEEEETRSLSDIELAHTRT